LRADLFYNHISNLIGITASSATTLTFANGGATGFQMGGGTADIYGGEAGVEAQLTPWLSGFTNYTYQEIGQTYGVTTSRVARGAPRFKTNAGLRADLENGLNGEAVVHYVGSATYAIDPAFFTVAAPPFNGPPPPNPRVGSYVLLNLRGAYKFWQEQAKAGHRREAELAFTVFNALNDKHKEHPLGETIGSRVMGWLTIKY
jgi:iron complex outermembrane receptor protein